MVSLSKTLRILAWALGFIALLLRCAVAGDYFIDQPTILVSNTASVGGAFSLDAEFPLTANQSLTGGPFEMTADLKPLSANHAPAALQDSFSRPANDDLKIELQSLLANDFDPDSDPISIQIPSVSNSGAPITVSNGWIYYLHTSGAPDSFNYTITDQYGAVSQSRVEILIGNPDDQFTTRLQIELNGTNIHIQFTGIFTRTYLVQRTDALAHSWIDLGPAANLGLGRFSFDDAGPGPIRFYRVVYRP